MSLQHQEGRLRTTTHGIVHVSREAYNSNEWRFAAAHEIGHFIQHPENDNYEA